MILYRRAKEVKIMDLSVIYEKHAPKIENLNNTCDAWKVSDEE